MNHEPSSRNPGGDASRPTERSLLGEILWNLQWTFVFGVPFLAIMELLIYLFSGEFSTSSITSGLSLLLFINTLFLVKDLSIRWNRRKKKR